MTRLGRSTIRALIAAASIVAVAGCHSSRRNVARVHGVEVDSIQPAIAARLDSAIPSRISKAQWQHVRALYGRSGNAPLWMDSGGVGPKARQLVSVLATAHQQAIDASAYPIAALRAALEPVLHGTPTAQQIARADLLLSTCYVAYGTTLLDGQIDPESANQSWHMPSERTNVDSVLASVLDASSFARALASLAPQDSAYGALVGALARYEQIAHAGGWPTVPDGPKVKPGRRADAARLDALRRRLVAEGYMAADSSRASGDASSSAIGSAVYTPELAGAVARFQERHALDPDSVLGKGTVKALNVPAPYRAAQIAANLERYRWLPRTFPPRYILVNLPAFHLEAYDDGKPVLGMRVVVGARDENKETPAFTKMMQYVVFRPYWYVTDSIAARELWPKEQANPGYLDEHGYQVIRLEGKRRIRQEPGDDNSLGLVKFMLPNDFDIYLHDTPEKSLFRKADRAASHGCIRVEHPAQLASWVLGWPNDKVEEAMNDGPDNHEVSLPKKIPVYIVYLTAWSDGGTLVFGEDLYQRDDPMVARVQSSLTPNAAVEALRREVLG